MRRRAFTLLELIVALALIVALGAIVTPVALEVRRGAADEHAIDLVSGALALARQDAMRQGEAIRLIAGPDERERVGLVGEFLTGDDPARRAEGDRSSRSGSGYQLLPRGYFLRRAPVEPEAIAELQASRDAFVPLPQPGRGGGRSASAPLTLAIFLPDGSAVVAGRTELVGPDGVIGVVELSAWTGRGICRPAGRSDGRSTLRNGPTGPDHSEDDLWEEFGPELAPTTGRRR